MTRLPPAAGADVPPGAVVPPGAAVAAGALVAPELELLSSPQATATVASAIHSADAFLNLMVLPFVGILVSPPRYTGRDMPTGLPIWLPPTCDRQYVPRYGNAPEP